MSTATEGGLKTAVRAAKLNSKQIGNVVRFIVRIKGYDLNKLRSIRSKPDGNVLVSWLNTADYCLIRLRRAVHQTLRGTAIGLTALRFRVQARDVRFVLSRLADEEKAVIAGTRYWLRRPDTILEVHRIINNTVSGIIRKRLKFVIDSDPGVSREDIVGEIIVECNRLLQVYDHFPPTMRTDRTKTTRSTLTLACQPIQHLVYVKADGRTLEPHEFTLERDRLTLARGVSKKPVELEIRYWHHLQLLNFVRRSVENYAIRLIEFHTAQCRARSVRTHVGDGGKTSHDRFRHTIVSFSEPNGDHSGSASRTTRLKGESIADPSVRVDFKLAESVMQMASILKHVNAMSDARLSKFVLICSGESVPEFDQWFRETLTGDPASLRNSQKLKVAAMKWLGLEDRDLLPLKDFLIRAILTAA